MDICEIPRWQQLKKTLQNLTFEEFDSMYKKDKRAVLIDARTPEEYDINHLPSAININYLSQTLADELEQLDPTKTYFIYCRTSRRSLRICMLLKNMGFNQIYHLKDGINEHL